MFEILEKLQKEQNIVEIKLLQSLINVEIENDFTSSLYDVCVNYNNFYGVDFILKIALLLKLKFD